MSQFWGQGFAFEILERKGSTLQCLSDSCSLETLGLTKQKTTYSKGTFFVM